MDVFLAETTNPPTTSSRLRRAPGAKHSVFFNPLLRKTSTVPRHKDIDNFLAKKICQDLGIEQPKKKIKNIKI